MWSNKKWKKFLIWVGPEDEEYPDMGCNFEIYTDPNILKIETLGPLALLSANGGTTEWKEDWFLYKTEVGVEEKEIDEILLKLVQETEGLI